MTRLYVSLTSIDVGDLVPTIERMEEAGVDGFHIDLSDGAFVPGLIFGTSIVESITRRTTLGVEVHLMTHSPESYFPQLIDGGAERISFHWEATEYPWRILSMLDAAGCPGGIAFNPKSVPPDISYFPHEPSFVNILTTEPDVVGEKMLRRMSDRVRAFRRALPLSTQIQVDGGVSPENARELVEAGASELVLGRALIAAPDPGAVVRAITRG